jgi:maltose O-acetyltransferase
MLRRVKLPETGGGSAWDNALAVVRARWYLRGADELGERVRVWGRPSLTLKGTLRIADRVRIFSMPVRTEFAVQKGATLEIGSRAFINYGCSISAAELIRIGPRCNIGSHVIIMDNDFHSLDPEHRLDVPPSAPIILEENVWIGVRATVLRGVTIGAGSVVAAGSVVTKDVPPRTLVGGLPAKVLREL